MSNGTDRIAAILNSCRDDAQEQIAALRGLIENGDSRDIRAMAVMALAAENTVKTVENYCRLGLAGGDHELARAAA